MKAINGYVIIRPVAAKEQLDSGLYLPTSQSQKPVDRGQIVSAPETIRVGEQEIPCPVQEGQTVLFSAGLGFAFGKDFVLRAVDIYAVEE